MPTDVSGFMRERSAEDLSRELDAARTTHWEDSEGSLETAIRCSEAAPHDELRGFTAKLATEVAQTSAVAEVLSLYRRGDGLPLSDALALAAEHNADRPFDAVAFGAAGAATARRGSASGAPTS